LPSVEPRVAKFNSILSARDKILLSGFPIPSILLSCLQFTKEQGMTKASVAIERLLGVMRRLRAPDGCPWDREQTNESLKSDLIEEAYEVIDASSGVP
jgi:hypothetical protein